MLGAALSEAGTQDKDLRLRSHAAAAEAPHARHAAAGRLRGFGRPEAEGGGPEILSSSAPTVTAGRCTDKGKERERAWWLRD